MGKFALQSEYCRSTAFRQKISITVGMLSYRPTSTCPYIELLYPLKQVIINPIYFVLSPKTDSILATHHSAIARPPSLHLAHQICFFFATQSSDFLQSRQFDCRLLLLCFFLQFTLKYVIFSHIMKVCLSV